jgi:hypothetical protein
MTSAMFAAKSKNVSFIILLAGTGIPGDELLLLQQELIGKASGISDEDLKKTKSTNSEVFEMVKKAKNSDQLNVDITEYITKSLKSDSKAKIPDGITESEYIAIQMSQITSPWMQFFIKYNSGHS